MGKRKFNLLNLVHQSPWESTRSHVCYVVRCTNVDILFFLLYFFGIHTKKDLGPPWGPYIWILKYCQATHWGGGWHMDNPKLGGGLKYYSLGILAHLDRWWLGCIYNHLQNAKVFTAQLSEGDWITRDLFSSLPLEMIQFDQHIFQMGWNHKLVKMPALV